MSDLSHVPEYLARSLKREREARRLAEALLEEKTRDLYLVNENLKAQYDLAVQHGRKVELLLSIINAAHNNLEMTEQMKNFIICVCKMADWPLGHIFLCPNNAHTNPGTVNGESMGYCKDKVFEPFYKTMTKHVIKQNLGLLEQVLDSGTSMWVPDLTAMSGGFPYSEVANNCNIHGAFAVPLMVGGQVLAIAEFFFSNIQEADTYLIKIVDAAAQQLSLHIEKQQKQLEYEDKLKYQGTHDFLTTLPNRILFMDRLTQAIKDAARSSKKIVVAFVDLDHFKTINDSLGHSSGDALLKIVSQRLRSELRATDTLSRFGGDEFVVMIPNQRDMHGIPGLLGRILHSVAQPCMIGQKEIIITCSVGLSVFPDDAADAETLVKNSDAAMYRAKENGKNNFEFFTKGMNTKINEQLELEHGLRHALENKELTVVYQPKLSYTTNTIIGTEALLRWTHPVFGVVPPVKFIPIADKIGTILPIGEWVLRTACAQNKAWQDAGFPPMIMSVNIAPRQFNQPNLIEMLQLILKDTGLEPQYLELELTEDLAMRNPQEFISLLKRIKEIGIKLSIDDFGTGYSSLSYLRQFPLDCLKIDRSFIQEMEEGNSGESIIKAIVSLGHSLNMNVIAEGIETADQFSNLKKLSCDEMQGYYLSKPIMSEEMSKFLAEHTVPPTKDI